MSEVKKYLPQRSFHGQQWLTMKTNKKYLMDDFHHKCAYCDDHDRFCGGSKHYHVDHFAPKARFSHLEFEYDNLLYACPYCNISKSNKWVGTNEQEAIVHDCGFVDPCSSDYASHLVRNDNGSIIAVTPLGQYMLVELKLYLERHRIIYMLEEIFIKREQLRKKMVETGDPDGKLKSAYGEISIVLCDYYDLLHDEEE